MSLENTRSIEITLGTIEDLIAAHLYAINEIHDNQDVKVRFGKVKGPLGDALTQKLVPINLEITNRQEVSRTEHNATEKEKLPPGV